MRKDNHYFAWGMTAVSAYTAGRACPPDPYFPKEEANI